MVILGKKSTEVQLEKGKCVPAKCTTEPIPSDLDANHVYTTGHGFGEMLLRVATHGHGKDDDDTFIFVPTTGHGKID